MLWLTRSILRVQGWVTGAQIAAMPTKVEKEAMTVLADAVDAALAAYNLEINPPDQVELSEEEYRELILFVEEKLTGAKFPFTRAGILREFKSRKYIVGAPGVTDQSRLPGQTGLSGGTKKAIALALLGLGLVVVITQQ